MRSQAVLGPMAAIAALAATMASAAERAGQVPITAASEEARELFLKGRDASEKLRIEDSRQLFAQAVAKDPRFALAHLAMANSAATAQGFFDELKRAVDLADHVTEGEKHVILGQDAGVRGDLDAQKEHYDKLVGAFPGDERVRVLLGNYHFGRQEYAAAIEHYAKATALAPDFSQPYNQLGYSHRFLGQYAAAEQAFKKYVELIPSEPNPHDSYAELLMKMGRFQESIDNYRKALSVDPHFIASYVGIANDQILLGRPAEARATLTKLRSEVARNDGERRQGLFWTAASWVHEGKHEKALETCRQLYAIAEKNRDPANMSFDLIQMGQILLHAGKPGQAQAEFARAVQAIEGAEVPAEVKENVRRNHLYFEARVALKKEDLKAAEAKAEAYRAQAERRKIPFELRRVHELAGLIALQRKAYGQAAAELERANHQDPEVLYSLAIAYQGQGDKAKARETCARAADFNELNFNHAFVRGAAKRMLAKLG